MKPCKTLANSIVTSDWHLTEAAHGEYRWEIFPKIMRAASRLGAATLYVLGDLTDAKDNHSAELVNRIWWEVSKLKLIVEVVFLKGNHDYRTGPAFFNWLDALRNVTFVTDIDLDEKGILYLPHTRTPAEDWADVNFSEAKCVLMHETAHGSIVSNGTRMAGLDPRLGVREDCLVLSGDVHVPQQVGDIVYVGSPYHVHFGDRFHPRILHFDSRGVAQDIHLDFPERFVVTVDGVEELSALAVEPGDMLKVRIRADAAAIDFRKTRGEILQWASSAGVHVQGLELAKRITHGRSLKRRDPTRGDGASDGGTRGRGEPAAAVRAYSERHGVDDSTMQYGVDIVRGLK